MALLLTILWPALVAALALGGLVGAWTGLPDRRPGLVGAVILTASAVVLTGLALAGVVAGRPGFWIETVALSLDAYLAGCLFGAVLRRRPVVAAR